MARLLFLVGVFLFLVVMWCAGCTVPDGPPVPLTADVEIRFTKSQASNTVTVSQVRNICEDMNRSGYRIVSVFHDRDTWSYVVVGQKLSVK